MTEQEVDRLLLEIDVNDKTEGGSDKLIESLATTVSKLNAEIQKLDIGKIEAVSKALASLQSGNLGAVGNSTKSGGTSKNSTVKALTKDLKELNELKQEIIKQRDETLSADFSDEHKQLLAEDYNKKLSALDEQIAQKQAEISSAQAQGGTAQQLPAMLDKASQSTLKLNSLTDILKYKLAEVRKQLESTELTQEEYVELKEKELRLEKQIKGNSKNSLVSSIKRVAVYRAIRAMLKMVTDAFKEGINNVALYSEEVNQALSTIKSSGTIVSNSIGVMLAPLLTALAPVVQYLAVGLGDLANGISYLTAKLQGNANYLKVNTEYFKKMNEQARLLSFDTFQKLQGGGNDVSDMFAKGEVADGFGKISDEMVTVSTLLSAIAGTLGVIGGLKVYKAFTSGALGKMFSGLKADLKASQSNVSALIAGFALLALGIIDLVTNWNNVNFENWEKALTIVSALVVGLVGAFVAVKALSLSLPVAIGLGMALAGATLLIGTEISKATNPKNYAFGGGYNSADLFYANENGQTELIASTNSGGGAVMNMQQLEGAIYSGMIRAMSSGSGGESAIYLDGNRVGTFIAGNNGFRNEANRRNTSLNWR